MEKIASFQVDHTRLLPGMYVSRMDGDVVTYDIRFIQPNTPPYMSTAAMHTIEHLFATYARSSVWGKGIVYVGPMGCRTGFYLLTRTGGHPDAVSPAEAIRLVREAMAFIAAFDGDIPGATEPGMPATTASTTCRVPVCSPRGCAKRSPAGRPKSWCTDAPGPGKGAEGNFAKQTERGGKPYGFPASL